MTGLIKGSASNANGNILQAAKHFSTLTLIELMKSFQVSDLLLLFFFGAADYLDKRILIGNLAFKLSEGTNDVVEVIDNYCFAYYFFFLFPPSVRDDDCLLADFKV